MRHCHPHSGSTQRQIFLSGLMFEEVALSYMPEELVLCWWVMSDSVVINLRRVVVYWRKFFRPTSEHDSSLVCNHLPATWAVHAVCLGQSNCWNLGNAYEPYWMIKLLPGESSGTQDTYFSHSRDCPCWISVNKKNLLVVPFSLISNVGKACSLLG